MEVLNRFCRTQKSVTWFYAIILVFTFPNPLLAQVQNFPQKDQLTEVIESSDGQNIEIEYSPDIENVYRERRSTWSGIYSVSVDNLFPEKFRSKDDGKSFGDIFGTKRISLAKIGIGTKLNFAIGGLTAEIQYGQGSVTEGVDASLRSLTLTKQSVGLGLIVDSIMSEPIVAPYFNANINRMDYTEVNSTPVFGGAIKKGSTSLFNSITVGALIQLNWLEPDLAMRSINDHGLNNSYLDLFFTQYSAPGGSEDPNLSSGFQAGGGLKLEF